MPKGIYPREIPNNVHKEILGLTNEQLEEKLLDLTGRFELSLEEVQVFYAIEKELERRKFANSDS